MKTLLLALCVIIVMLVVKVQAQPPIPATEAHEHIGQIMSVQGYVDQVFHSHNSNIFLTMKGKYPFQEFTGEILGLSVNSFRGIDSVQGKKVIITGRIQAYRGKTRIIVSHPQQIEVVEIHHAKQDADTDILFYPNLIGM